MLSESSCPRPNRHPLLQRRPVVCLTLVMALMLIARNANGEGPPAAIGPEFKAVTFLNDEVRSWSRQNHCFSCHNNGDAARALYRAASAGYPVPNDVLAETTHWLNNPASWEHNGGDGPQNDRRLARVIFATTLDTAVRTGWIRDRSALTVAVERLALDQAFDGSWPLGGDDALGSPATYGRALATLVARQSLFSADPSRFRAAIDRADNWLARQEIKTVTAASVSLLASAERQAGTDVVRRATSVQLLRQAQSQDGGWGPHISSPPEPFDTALAILALARSSRSAEIDGMLRRGRAFLVAQQRDDGSWIETTRPPGNVSYAQQISTAGWATLALLATRDFSTGAAVDPKR
jgi:hypothetical protein